MRIELTATTPEDTMAVGEAVASLIREGDALALTGELGAGKTVVVGITDSAAARAHVARVRSELARGAKFEDVAKRESSDSGSGQRGGVFRHLNLRIVCRLADVLKHCHVNHAAQRRDDQRPGIVSAARPE